MKEGSLGLQDRAVLLSSLLHQSNEGSIVFYSAPGVCMYFDEFLPSDSSLNVGRLISGVTPESSYSSAAERNNSSKPSQRGSRTSLPEAIDLKCTYFHLEELALLRRNDGQGKEQRFAGESCQKQQKSLVYHDMREELQKEKKEERLRSQFAILSFEKPVIVSCRHQRNDAALSMLFVSP